MLNIVKKGETQGKYHVSAANICYNDSKYWEYTSFKNVCEIKIYFKAEISNNSKNMYKGN